MNITDININQIVNINTESSIGFKTIQTKIKDKIDNGIYVQMFVTTASETETLASILQDKITVQISNDTSTVVWDEVKVTPSLKGGRVLLLLETEKEGKTENKREAFRLRFIYDSVLHLSPVDGKKSTKEVQVRVKDISLKGIGFETTELIELGTFVDIDMPFGEATAPIHAKVLRRIKLDKKGIYMYGSSVLEGGIIKDIVMEEQRRQLRKW